MIAGNPKIKKIHYETIHQAIKELEKVLHEAQPKK